jgi:hypothetical protein
LLEKRPIQFLFNGETKPVRVAPLKDGFEAPAIIGVPASLSHDGETIAFINARYSYPGRLVQNTSHDPLRGNLTVVNTADFIGEVGIIGSHRIHALGASPYSGQVEFIYGECECGRWTT